MIAGRKFNYIYWAKFKPFRVGLFGFNDKWEREVEIWALIYTLIMQI